MTRRAGFLGGGVGAALFDFGDIASQFPLEPSDATIGKVGERGSGGRLFEELFIPLTKYPRNVAGWARWPANWAALKQARDAMAKQKN